MVEITSGEVKGVGQLVMERNPYLCLEFYISPILVVGERANEAIQYIAQSTARSWVEGREVVVSSAR